MKSLCFRLLTASLSLTASVLLATPAMADTLTGATVAGTLNGIGDISVTTPFTSPTVVGPGVEFTGVLHDSGFNQTFDVAVDLGADGFTVAITSPRTGANLLDGDLFGITLSGLPSFVEGFTLTNYTCDSVDFACASPPYAVSGLASNTFSSSAVTLDFSTLANGQTYTFTDVRAPAATPEPSTLALLGTGVLGAAGVIRRRLVRS